MQTIGYINKQMIVVSCLVGVEILQARIPCPLYGCPAESGRCETPNLKLGH